MPLLLVKRPENKVALWWTATRDFVGEPMSRAAMVNHLTVQAREDVERLVDSALQGRGTVLVPSILDPGPWDNRPINLPSIP